MNYLLDVDALIALGHFEHAHHTRVACWLRSNSSSVLLTCSITELGFVRILSQAPAYNFSVSQAKALLAGLKQSQEYSFKFVPDGNDASQLPAWVNTGKQTTDGHLLQLAGAHNAQLATFDNNIPGSFLIP